MNQEAAKFIDSKIREFDTIVISRHVNPDPDCLGAQIAMRDMIKKEFPNKKVYAVGMNANHLKYMGELDDVRGINFKEALAIILDTPDKKRVDTIDVDDFKYSIKIDHHPFDHKYCDFEVIDSTSSSTCELIVQICYLLGIKIDSLIAEKLYTGIISDTERFLQTYTNFNTYTNIAKLIKDSNIDITKVYKNLYLRPITDYKILGYIYSNITITENGFAYIKLTNDWIQENKVDTQVIGKIANCLNYIEEILAWAIITENNVDIRVSLRSRGPVINDIAIKYGGGGHKYISGVSLNSDEEVLKIIHDLDQKCKLYICELSDY